MYDICIRFRLTRLTPLQPSIRLRFTNSFRWFTYLVDKLQAVLDSKVDQAREALYHRHQPEPAPPSEPASPAEPAPQPERVRPSIYLQRCCPLCFGGNRRHLASLLYVPRRENMD